MMLRLTIEVLPEFCTKTLQWESSCIEIR